MHAGGDIGLVAEHGIQGQALERLEDGRDRAVRHLQGLEDLAHRAVVAQVLLLRLLDHHVVLRHGADEETFLLGVLDQADGFLAPDRDREHGAREEHRVAEREHREDLREFGLVYFKQAFSLHNGNDADFCASGEGEFFILSHTYCQIVSKVGFLEPLANIVNLRAMSKKLQISF